MESLNLTFIKQYAIKDKVSVFSDIRMQMFVQMIDNAYQVYHTV